MSNVKRWYRVWGDCYNPSCHMAKASDGDWVAWEDHRAALDAAVEEMRETLRAVLDAPVVVNDDGATVRSNLEVQRATRDLRARAERLVGDRS